MAKQDKLKKKLKQLKRKLAQQSGVPKSAEKEIKRLGRELKARDETIEELRRQLAEQQGSDAPQSDTLLVEDSDETRLALAHKDAWKRHKFLGERYDVHLADGHAKDKARAMANRDLVKRYGKRVGFTAEQLRDILS